MGWQRLKNGVLLSTASVAFDVFLTIDKNLKHQQNLAALPMAVIVILAPGNRLSDVAPFVPQVLQTLTTIQRGMLVEISLPPATPP